MDARITKAIPTEADLYKAIKRRLPTYDLARIENSTAMGFPDVNGCTKEGHEFWLELKVCDEPSRPDTPALKNLRPSQAAWLYRRGIRQSPVWLVALIGDNVYMVHGSRMASLSDTRLANIKSIADHVMRYDQLEMIAEVIQIFLRQRSL